MSIEAMNWAYTQSVGDGIAKSVLVALSNQADQDGKCWPGIDYITARTEFARRTVISKLEWLEAAGYLTRERRIGGEAGGAKSTIYYLRMSEGAPVALSSEGARHASEGAPPAPEQSVNNQLSCIRERAEFVALAAQYNAEHECDDWLSVLKKKKAAMSQAAWTRRTNILRQLIADNENIPDAFARAADGGWSRLYGKKDRSNGRTRENPADRRAREADEYRRRILAGQA